MSIQNLLNIGVNSLTAYRGAMEQTSQNAANVGTPGYTRRRGSLTSLSLGRDVPAGVQFRDPRRIIDNLASATVRRTRAEGGALNGRVATLRTLEATLAPVEGSLTERVGALFDGFSALSARAGGREERAALLSTAQTLAESFRNTSAQLTAMQRPLEQTAQDHADRINQITAQVAGLNRGIRAAEGGRGEAAELRDQRDRLVDELSGLVQVSVLEHKDGAITVSLSNGQALVTDVDAARLDVELQGDTLQVSFQRSDKSPRLILRDGGLGGELGAALRAHNQDLRGEVEALDEAAWALAQSVNELHREGVGIDGQGGRDFFAVDGPEGAASTLRLAAAVADNPSAIAATRDRGRLPGGAELLGELAALRDEGLEALGGLSVEEHLTTARLELGRELERVEDALAVSEDQGALFEGLRASTQGVNLDEEIADLLRFQRGFEAAGRVVQVADEVMQTLLSIV
jgi:flagellar hook-associated protein 1 FlgK